MLNGCRSSINSLLTTTLLLHFFPSVISFLPQWALLKIFGRGSVFRWLGNWNGLPTLESYQNSSKPNSCRWAANGWKLWRGKDHASLKLKRKDKLRLPWQKHWMENPMGEKSGNALLPEAQNFLLFLKFCHYRAQGKKMHERRELINGKLRKLGHRWEKMTWTGYWMGLDV